MVLTEFWTIDFQGRFSQVGSHKLWLYIFFIFIFFVFGFFLSHFLQSAFFLRHESQFSSKFGPKLSLPSPLFPERFQPITAAAMCTVAINFLEPGAFNALNLSISYPYLIKFHDFAGNIQEGMKHQMWGAGCNSVPTGHDFPDNSNIYFLFSYHGNRTFLRMWESIRFSNWLPGENLGCSHLQRQPSIRFSWQLTSPVLIDRFSLITGWQQYPVLIQWVRTAQHWSGRLNKIASIISCLLTVYPHLLVFVLHSCSPLPHSQRA